jgi:peptidoglycan/LPS O-acetylase OafA/YrhL
MTVEATSTARAPVRHHLHPVDLFRVVTFTGVVAVHSLTTTASTHASVQALLLLLHYTREGFFFLMTLVLVYTTYRHPPKATSFWRKRFPLILAPYLVWTIVYVWVDRESAGQTNSETLHDFGQTLLIGHYQMYFLVVSMQLYAIFPLLLWVVRKTSGHHWELLAISAVLEVVTMELLHLHDMRPPTGAAGVIVNNAMRMLPTYQLYLFLGAVMAVHLEAVQQWIRSNRRTIWIVATLALVICEAWFVQSLRQGSPLAQAADVFQPTMVLWNVAFGLLLYSLGMTWADRRRERSWPSRLITEGSDLSFGVYLSHALMLFTVIPAIPGFLTLPEPAKSICTLLATLLFSASFSWLALRSPFARQIVGRARKPLLRRRDRDDTALTAFVNVRAGHRPS